MFSVWLEAKIQHPKEGKKMKVVCAWCGKSLGEKEPYDSEETSHGMCDDCQLTFNEKIEEDIPLQEKRQEENN
jgi:uncharacterized CHY-type Zn-finger protein